MQSSAAQTAENQELDAALIARHTADVRHLARKYSNGANTDDLAQEGLIALLGARRSWREEAQFWTYARQVVRTAMIRYATKEVALLGGDQIVDVESDAPSAEATLELAEGVSRLSASMIALSEPERRIVRMHIGEDLSLAAIARALGMSADKVERTYRGALEKLRELQS